MKIWIIAIVAVFLGFVSLAHATHKGIPPVPEENELVGPMSPEQIAEVQLQLYNHNYRPGPIDGKLGPKTLEAIRRFQTVIDHPVTGRLTRSELRILLVPVNVKWGAVSASTDGQWGASWSKKDRHTAEEEALAQCRRRSIIPTKCTTAAQFSENFLVAVLCTSGGYNFVTATANFGDSRDVVEYAKTSLRKKFKIQFRDRQCRTLVILNATYGVMNGT